MSDPAVDTSNSAAPLTPLARRVGFTLGALAVYFASRFVPLVGLDRARLWELLNTPGSLREYDRAGGGGLASGSVNSLGITPYLAATILVLLLSGVVPAVRAWRDDPERRGRFERLILAATIIVGFLQGWGAVLAYGARDPGMRLLEATILAAASGLVALLAQRISERGIANGVAVILLATFVLPLGAGALSELGAIARGVHGPLADVVDLVVLAALFVACVRVTAAAHPLAIHDGASPLGAGGEVGDPVTAPLRYNAVGSVPMKLGRVAAGGVAMLLGGHLSAVAGFAITAIAIIAATYLWTALTFDPVDLVDRVKRWGCTLRDGDGRELAATEIDRQVLRMTHAFAGGLVILSAMPYVMRSLPPLDARFESLAGAPMLFLAATYLVIRDEVVAAGKLSRGAPPATDEAGGTWVSIFVGDTDLDVAIARGLLASAGIRSVRSSTRPICAVGTLGYWESCRPRFPAIAVHRALGGGAVRALVRREDAERAAGLLARRYSRDLLS